MLCRLPRLTFSLLLCGLFGKKYLEIEDGVECLYGYARYALKDACLIMGLKEGDCILFPDYICDVTIKPYNDLNIKVKYYSVNDALEPDWTEVETLLKNGVKAVLTVNYFGFPQDLERWKTITEQFRVWWIEDNAHGYGGKYKDVELGSWGHVSVSSIRKTLPILSGALLRINDLKLQRSEFWLNKKADKTRKILSKEELLRILGYFLRWFNIPYNRYRSVPEPKTFTNFDGCSQGNIDIISKLILPEVMRNTEGICQKRSKIYKAWHNFCMKNNLYPLFLDLPAGISPFVFPCYTDGLESRQKWLKWGRDNDVEVYPWPNLPKQVYARGGAAVERLKKIICFPINQEMKTEEISNLKGCL
jgi:dTDP-4-amino-4,6-dideoxygalactose transaminase